MSEGYQAIHSQHFLLYSNTIATVQIMQMNDKFHDNLYYGFSRTNSRKCQTNAS